MLTYCPLGITSDPFPRRESKDSRDEIQGSFVERSVKTRFRIMGSAVGVEALPGVVLLGGRGRKVVSRASQCVVSRDCREEDDCSAAAG